MRRRRDGISGAFDALRELSDPSRKRHRCGVEWFWRHVDKNGPVPREGLTPCWLFTGRLTPDGHGVLGWCGRTRIAHRVAFCLSKGPIKEGEVIRHECDVPRCVNPDHLIAGSIGDNNRDAVVRGRHRTPFTGRTGSTHYRAKLTDDLVRRYRAAWRAGEPITSIASRAGLAVGTVHPMLHGKTWRHVTDSEWAPTLGGGES